MVVIAAAVAALTAGLWVEGAAAKLPEDLVAIDSVGVATPFGVVTRVPAVSDGGVDYSTIQLTLDKATARAASFTPGELAESFLEISDRPLDDVDPSLQPPEAEYKNPTLVKAQFPPSASTGAPESAEALGGNIRARATDAPLARADATGGGFNGGGVVTAGGGTSWSQGEVLGNGTVVTTAVAQAVDVVIAGVVSIASVSSFATAQVPSEGPGAQELSIVVGGVQVAGVPAELTPDGLRVSDEVPVSGEQVAMFNQALARLADEGIVVTGFPNIVRTSDATSAEAGGAAVSVRYDVTDRGLPGSGLGDIPYDEEILLGQVKARALARHRSPAALPPPIDSAIGATIDTDLGLLPAELVEGVGVPAPEIGASAPTTTGGDVDLGLIGTRDSPEVVRFRTLYRMFLLAAFTGAALLLARRRTRLT